MFSYFIKKTIVYSFYKFIRPLYNYIYYDIICTRDMVSSPHHFRLKKWIFSFRNTLQMLETMKCRNWDQDIG